MFISYTLLSLVIECQRDQLSGWFAWTLPYLIHFLTSIVYRATVGQLHSYMVVRFPPWQGLQCNAFIFTRPGLANLCIKVIINNQSNQTVL